LLEEFLLAAVAKVLAREPYRITRTVLKFATEAPCFARLDERGEADVFAVGAHLDSRGRAALYVQDLLAVCQHYGLPEERVIREIRADSGS
jgi:hypothetical protein